MYRAAIDLGSNSFHLLIARMGGGQPEVVLHLRETVRLAGGMDAEGRLAPEARTRALECLQRFAGHLREHDVQQVRAVGTNTLRITRDSGSFLEEVAGVLGHPVEVISGEEEARLIHLGVVCEYEPQPGEMLLVLDIGGGSTEVVIGDSASRSVCESVAVGCVGLSERHFPGGALSAEGLAAARSEARSALRATAARCLTAGWSRAVATSGTAHAIRDVTAAGSGAVPVSVVAGLCAQMARHAHIDELDLNGLEADRRPILPGGAAILLELCGLLGIDELVIADQALRNGLLHEAFHAPVTELTR